MRNNRANLVIDQGAEFKQTLTWYTDNAQTLPKDLTGFTAKMQIRPNYDADSIIDLTTENSRITISAPLTGKIVLQIDEADTAALAVGNYIYDLKLIKAGDTTRLIQGNITVDRAVTV